MYLPTILLFILVPVSLIYLVYKILKRLGGKKLALWFAGLLTTGLLIIILLFVFEDSFFSKSDAIHQLQEHQIELKDDFEIISNQF